MKIVGKVIKGKGKGKKLGFPTANLELRDKIESGVYVGQVEVGSNLPAGEAGKYDAAIFVSRDGKRLEAHFLDFEGDLLGEEIEITISDRLRDIMVFSSDKELAEQIREDISRLTQMATQSNAETQINAEKEMSQINADDFLYPDITYSIRGACFKVYKQFGGSFKEKVVENALAEELTIRGLSIDRQKRIEIRYNGKKVGTYVPDMVVNDKVLIELKCKPFITKEDERQFWLYLKGSDYKLGLLINFGSKRLDIKRRIYDAARNKSA